MNTMVLPRRARQMRAKLARLDTLTAVVSFIPILFIDIQKSH